MSKTVNKVELLGRVGADPELRYAQSGTAVARLRVATDRGARQNRESEADWHDIVCWGKLAEAVNQYVGKGDRLYVAGRLAQSSWEGEDGQRRWRVEVHAAEVVFLDFRGVERSSKDGVRGSRREAAASPF